MRPAISPLIHLLTHSFTRELTHALIYALTHHSLIHSFTPTHALRMKLNARKRFDLGEARALFEKPLKFLHVHTLREYLAAEFASTKEILEKKHDYDFENIVDDFVFMVRALWNLHMHMPHMIYYI